MTRNFIKLIHEGKCAVDVQIALVDSDESRSPTISADDALKRDAVRPDLRRGNVAVAAKHGRVFELTSVAAE